MLWGAAWSGLWGAGGSAAEVICAEAFEDLQSYVPEDGNTHKFTCALVATQGGVFVETTTAVIGGFGIDTATADRQDKIGAIIGLPRRGVTDDTYRLYQTIQAELLLAAQSDDKPRTGSSENILSICRTFIGAAVVSPIVLLNVPPLSILLSIPSLAVAQAEQLAAFIRIAVDAAVDGLILFEDPDNGAVWDDTRVSVSGTTAVWDDTRVSVSGTLAEWGTSVDIITP